MADLLKDRITQLQSSEKEGKCVLYVMSRDQRVKDNHALLCAQKHALAKKLPLAVIFVLYDKVGVRAREQYDFMIEGLREVEKNLAELNIPFMMLIGNPKDRLLATFGHLEPEAVYFDFNPLRGPVKLQKEIAKELSCKVYVVDTHNIVPARIVSDKKEVGAYTFRLKIHKKLTEYLVEPEKPAVHPYAWPGVIKSLDDLEEMIKEVLEKQPSNHTKLVYTAGESAAATHLQDFIDTKLERYAVDRNDPSSGSQSDLSPYLHFGQIAALRVALELQLVVRGNNNELHLLESSKMPKPEHAETTLQHGVDSLIEEMVVRKELADNYCLREKNYDNIDAAAEWARKSLDAHRDDPREFLYSKKEFELAKTHDEAWNAAQRQLTNSGKMHGYMRMYWAKKVLEWTESPEEAIEILVYLNDHYSIDGGDPSGYAGILWSVAGVHDRPWQERDVFGVIRYMNYAGLKRKFDIETYIGQWKSKAEK